MIRNKKLDIIGFASGLGAGDNKTSDGPLKMQHSPYLKKLIEQGIETNWQIIKEDPTWANKSKLEILTLLSKKLATAVFDAYEAKKFFTVIGGDHSSGIGTWSGAYHAIKNKGSMGLIWIDAHMDSHVPETSPSGNLHGMPLACLLGHGDANLKNLMDSEPKLKPQNLCLIGVRSFEEEESNLLKKLNVRIFYIEEVKQRGLKAVMQDAIQVAMDNTAGFGLSVDIDSMDPSDAPGTGVIEPNGIPADELCEELQVFAKMPEMLGLEIAEFNPYRDRDDKTEKLVVRLLSNVILGKDVGG